MNAACYVCPSVVAWAFAEYRLLPDVITLVVR
jgi:hypothetical protein